MNTNTNPNSNPNTSPNPYEQLNKISADVCNIMEEFNRTHGPHPRDVQRRAKKAAYQRAHQYDPAIYNKTIQRKVDRMNKVTRPPKPSHCSRCNRAYNPSSTDGTPRRLVYYNNNWVCIRCMRDSK